MSRRPPRSTRTDTLFPYTTLFRSVLIWVIRFADASIRVTGIDRPSSVNTRLIPHLRPTMPIVMVLASVQRSEEHTSELQSLMSISYAVFCLKKKIEITTKGQVQEQGKALTKTQHQA